MTATQTQAAVPETVAVPVAGGTMGFPIARNIARAGIPVRAWNRSRDKAEPLAKDGAYIADMPQDAAREAAIVITMPAGEDAVIRRRVDLPYLRMKAKAMGERDFTPAFRLTLAAKDAGLVRQAAEDRGMDLPLAGTIARRLAQCAKEHGDEDFSATYLTSTPDH